MGRQIYVHTVDPHDPVLEIERGLPFIRLSRPYREWFTGLIGGREHEYRTFERAAWALVIVMSIADIVTTLLAIQHPSITEMNPLAHWLLYDIGVSAWIAKNIIGVGICYAIWRATPVPLRALVPLLVGLDLFRAATTNVIVMAEFGML